MLDWRRAFFVGIISPFEGFVPAKGWHPLPQLGEPGYQHLPHATAVRRTREQKIARDAHFREVNAHNQQFGDRTRLGMTREQSMAAHNGKRALGRMIQGGVELEREAAEERRRQRQLNETIKRNRERADRSAHGRQRESADRNFVLHPRGEAPQQRSSGQSSRSSASSSWERPSWSRGGWNSGASGSGGSSWSRR